jgi:hypothetical protein
MTDMYVTGHGFVVAAESAAEAREVAREAIERARTERRKVGTVPPWWPVLGR